MASGLELKKFTKSRIKTVRTLVTAEDWDAAAYMMGYVLETALKAAACKALHLTGYPERTRIKHIDNCFMTHKFDQLLTVSGLSDIFTVAGLPGPSTNWSEFVQSYPGEWTNMRYDPNTIIQFDKPVVERLFQNLISDNESIIKTIQSKSRW
jgi:hypothetical protein